uniref:PUB domain-containing protein n=1 Tax=Fabrea salina TaxID=342563 RepID=A0A7S3MUE3_9CILI|mmetsp:Transcript_577/g.950  ORF Transcript_577/g.950 Transcript_577/m.950 type:complete len:144 (+) Transcript_577:423-854(+)
MGCCGTSKMSANDVGNTKVPIKEPPSKPLKGPQETAKSPLKDKLETLRKEVTKNKADFEHSVETLKLIVKNVANNFGNQKFKTIRKENNKFKKAIGQYPSGKALMKVVGFIEKEDCFNYNVSLPKSYVKNKLLDIEIAIKELK